MTLEKYKFITIEEWHKPKGLFAILNLYSFFSFVIAIKFKKVFVM